MLLRSTLFWDISISNLDINEQAEFIIVRVMMFGELDDVRAIFKYYGKEKIMNSLQDAHFLDRITHSFSSLFFNIPRNQFRCY